MDARFLMDGHGVRVVKESARFGGKVKSYDDKGSL